MYEEDDFPEVQYDDTAERAALAGVMKAPERLGDAFMTIPPDYWFTPRARHLAEHINSMLRAGKPVTEFTVAIEAQRAGLFPDVIHPNYLHSCQALHPTGEQALEAIGRIRELSEARAIWDATTRAAQKTRTAGETGTDPADIDEIVAELRGNLDNIEALRAGQSQDGPLRMKSALADFVDDIDKPVEELRTIPTPWPELDEILSGGLHPKKLHLFAGRPGGGKSLALTNIAAYAAERGHSGILFSAEMGVSEVVGRIVAAEARAEYGQITNRSLDLRNRTKVMNWVQQAQDMPLWIDDRSTITIDQIRATARRMKKRPEGLDFVCVDYVQFLKPTNTKVTRDQQISDITLGLKTMALELDVAVISAAQLNREAVKENRKPQLSDLRESGSLENHSDIVVLLHHPMLDGRRTGEVMFLVEKNRAGKKAELTMDFKGYQARIASPSDAARAFAS